MQTDTAHRRKRIAREWSNDVESFDRYVDIGVNLHIVRADPSGTVLFPGGRPMIEVGVRRYGGMLDTAASPPHIPDGPDGLSKNPQEWYCSEDQFAVIEHPDSEPVGKLALGGMGAGKTTAGVIWLYLRWLESINERVEAASLARQRARERDEPDPPAPSPKEGGITAPTETRLMAVLNEMFDRFPGSWWSFNGDTKIVTMCDQFRWRGVSTHRQSEKQGSRVQQFNWVALLMDELQDQVDEFINAQARLRSKQDGRAKRVATATAKDLPAWRALKDEMVGSGLWRLHSMLGPRSPFIHPDHWESLKKLTTDRDYRRLVLAEDLPPESRLYNAFDRKYNLRPLPILHAKKVTSLVISRKIGGSGWGVGIGHDPGTAKAASVWCDAYMLPRRVAEEYGAPWDEHVWFARAEHFTHHKSPEEHALGALKITQDKFGCNRVPGGDRAHVRCQPLGSAEDKPDLSTLSVWKRTGFDIRVAQYSKTGQGVGQIKKENRFSVVNTLFCNAYGKRRLFIEVDEHGQPTCPQLLSAIETMERDDKGRGEHEEKDIRHDKSDLPAALGYWLYPWEKELASALRSDIKRSLG